MEETKRKPLPLGRPNWNSLGEFCCLVLMLALPAFFSQSRTNFLAQRWGVTTQAVSDLFNVLFVLVCLVSVIFLIRDCFDGRPWRGIKINPGMWDSDKVD